MYIVEKAFHWWIPCTRTTTVRYESWRCSSDQSSCQSCAPGELSPSSFPAPQLQHANTICHTSSKLGPLSHTYCIIVSAEQAKEGKDISIIIDKSMPREEEWKADLINNWFRLNSLLKRVPLKWICSMYCLGSAPAIRTSCVSPYSSVCQRLFPQKSWNRCCFRIISFLYVNVCVDMILFIFLPVF